MQDCVAKAGAGQGGLSKPWLPLASLVAVLCLGLMLKTVLATGPLGSDDMVYYHAAEDLLHSGKLLQVNQHYARLLYIVLAAVPAVLGGHIIYGVLANLFYSTVLDVVVAAFAYRTLGPWPAVVAAIMTSLNGITLIWSGIMLPDLVLSLFMFVAVMLVCRACLPNPSFPPLVLLAAGGVATGFSYAVKESGILLLPPVVFSLAVLPSALSVRTRFFSVMAYLGGFIAVFTILSLLQAWLSSDILYRVHAVAEGHNRFMPTTPWREYLRHMAWSVMSVWTTYRQVLLLPFAAAGLAWCADIIRPSTTRVFALCGLFVTAYLTFGSTSLSELKPLPFEPRYLAPIMPFIAMSVAALFARMDCSKPLLKALWVGFLAVFVIQSLSGAAKEAGHVVRARFYKNAAMAVQGTLTVDSDAKIWVDSRTRDMLSQFLPPQTWASLQAIPINGELAEGYYLINPQAYLGFNYGMAPHFEEIVKLPVIASVNFDQRVLSRYIPGGAGEVFPPNLLSTAVLRKK